MNQEHSSARMTLWANRGIFGVIIVMLFALPALLEWYTGFQDLSAAQEKAILIAFYCCAVVILRALWSMERLLRNIIGSRVFVRENVKLIRRVCLCCAGVGLICLPAGFVYPPLLFLTVIMAFLALVVNVVCQVIRAAVLLREENELTI